MHSQTRSIHRKLVPAFCALVLASCAQLGQRGPDPAADGLLDKPLPASWFSSGKIALHPVDATATPALKSQVVSYRWQQDNDNLKLSLSGALGLGRLVIEQNEQGASIRRGAEILSQAERLDQLLWEQTGIELPAHYLRHWVLGRPSPTATFTALQLNDSASSGLAGFKQQDWHIHFPRTALVDGHLLPRRIEAENGLISLRIAISRWELSAQSPDISP